MNLHNLIKTIIAITIISFFCLYFTTMGGYYEYNLMQKNTHFKRLIDLKFFADFGKGKTNINYTKH